MRLIDAAGKPSRVGAGTAADLRDDVRALRLPMRVESMHSVDHPERLAIVEHKDRGMVTPARNNAAYCATTPGSVSARAQTLSLTQTREIAIGMHLRSSALQPINGMAPPVSTTETDSR